MLVICNTLDPENTLEVDKVFINVQSVDDNNLDENFAQMIFTSDENYSNFKKIKDFFSKIKDSNEIGTYYLMHHTDLSKPILTMPNLKIRSMGINLEDDKDLSPSIIVDLVTRYANINNG